MTGVQTLRHMQISSMRPNFLFVVRRVVFCASIMSPFLAIDVWFQRSLDFLHELSIFRQKNGRWNWKFSSFCTCDRNYALLFLRFTELRAHTFEQLYLKSHVILWTATKAPYIDNFFMVTLYYYNMSSIYERYYL